MSNPAGKIPVTPYDPYKFFRKGTTANNNVAISGGDEQASFRLSIGNVHQTGVVPTTKYDKTTFSLNGQKQITSKFSASGGMNYTNSVSNKSQQGSNISGIMLGLLRTPPTFDNSYGLSNSNAVSDSRSYVFADGTQRDYRNGPGYDNPYWSVNRNPYREELNRVYGYGQANYQLLDWMTLSYRLGADVYSQNVKNAYDIKSNAFASSGGAIYLINYTNKQVNSDIMLNMHKSFSSDLNLNVLLGQNYSTITYSNALSGGFGLTLPNFLDMSNASSTIGVENESRIRRMAWYGQAELGYKNMLYLTLTGRDETTSTLRESNSNYFYPSAGLSFIFTEPLHLSGSKTLSYGKVRASLAGAGKDAGAQSLQTYYHSAAMADGFTGGLTWPINGLTGYQISSATSVIGNPNLKPEHTNSFEAGTDLSFFRNRISLSATYYGSKTTDQIFTVPIAYSTGFASAIFNAGVMSNHGIELTLNTNPVKTKWGLRWDLNFNWSKNVNKVETLKAGVDQLLVAGFTNGGVYAVPGQPYGVIMGTQYVRDSKGNIVINDDPTDPGYAMPIAGSKNVPLGNIQPDWLGSITNNLSYKGFTLGFQIDIRQGGKMWDGTRGAIDYFGTGGETVNRNKAVTFSGVMGHVDADGNVVSSGVKNTTATTYSQYYWQNIGSSFIGPTEPNIEDASWVRLRQISLTYALPTAFIQKAHFQALSLTVFMNNVLLMTKYKGVDPEASLAGPANGQGLDYFNNPGIKSYGIRLNVGL
jgi:TonB-linked SusC/RagA family outer membrane protein